MSQYVLCANGVPIAVLPPGTKARDVEQILTQLPEYLKQQGYPDDARCHLQLVPEIAIADLAGKAPA